MQAQSNTSQNPFAQVDWQDVLETLRAQKCVLFLGTGGIPAIGGNSMEAALCKWLKANDPDHPWIRLYNPDGFFLFKKNRYKRRVIAEMKKFYHQSFPEAESQLSQLARIPFSTIITLTPDNLLGRVFDRLGLQYQTDFYFPNRRASNQFISPTKDQSLIYNLLGNIEEPESLVLTHSDFFDYLASIFQGQGINAEFLDELEQMERYIFLGLPYEKWYFQLLLRVLSLHSDRLKEVERLALKEFEDPHWHKIYTAEFKMEFFPANTEAFINELYRRCQAEKLLKPLPEPDAKLAGLPDTSLSALREYLAAADTKKALLHLQAYIDRRVPSSHQLSNDVIVLRNQYKLLQQRTKRGTIDSRDMVVENNWIIERCLELIDLAKSL